MFKYFVHVQSDGKYSLTETLEGDPITIDSSSKGSYVAKDMGIQEVCATLVCLYDRINELVYRPSIKLQSNQGIELVPVGKARDNDALNAIGILVNSINEKHSALIRLGLQNERLETTVHAVSLLLDRAIGRI